MAATFIDALIVQHNNDVKLVDGVFGEAGTIPTPAAGGGITVGTTTITSGTDTRIPFNDGGVYGEDAGLTWDKTNKRLKITRSGDHLVLVTGAQTVIIGSGVDPNTTFTGSLNTGIGANIYRDLTTGSSNTMLGRSTGITITTGSNNVFIGDNSGNHNTTASNNAGTGTTASNGNLGFWSHTWGTSAAKVLSIINGTAPGSAITNGIQWFAVDSSDATSTLGLYLEQAVEAIGTFTGSHKIKIQVNGTFYWVELDAV